MAVSGGISAPPAHRSELAAQASSFATSGAGFTSSPPAAATPLASGRPDNFVLSRKPKQRIEDISTWLEAFSVYCLVLVSYFPHRWKNLLQYQLLILRTFRQFSTPVWLSYDRAFRENAAATNLTEEVKPSPEAAKDDAWVASSLR